MTQVNGMKNLIIQVTDFLKGPMVDLLFYCLIILYQENVTSEKFSHSRTL